MFVLSPVGSFRGFALPSGPSGCCEAGRGGQQGPGDHWLHSQERINCLEGTHEFFEAVGFQKALLPVPDQGKAGGAGRQLCWEEGRGGGLSLPQQ